jgi:pimeloyl-ACP methyl ester carboxylesterase
MNAQSSPSQGAINIVLVHGAWADGSSWSKVIPRLRERGFNVTAVQLPLTSIADDVGATARALALQNGPVLLVGHSYGGVVITQAGSDPKVSGLLYVAAYAPDDGESAKTLAYRYPTPVDSQIMPDSSGFLKLTPDGIAEDFAPDLSEVEKQVLTATQGPWSYVAFSTPVSSPAWKKKPTWFIIAANDQVISPVLEATEAQNMHATTIALPTSHVAMLADPESVARFIAEAAYNLAKK